jgi:hypothetical protein
MDLVALDSELQKLVLKKNELSVMDYGNEAYDDIEEELHDMEDDFSEKFGTYLEEAFYDVHDEFCPDSDVLMPIAYLGKKYEVKDEEFDVTFNEGVYVEMDDYPDLDTKLVLLPNPTRIMLQISKEERNIVWTAGQ